MKFNDLKSKLKYIERWHKGFAASEKKKTLEIAGYTPTYLDLEKSLKACKRKHYAYYGKSKYMPHQGCHEQERRRG